MKIIKDILGFIIDIPSVLVKATFFTFLSILVAALIVLILLGVVRF